MRLGRILGVPVKLNALTLPLAAAALWLGEGERLAALFFSVLIHETAHVLAARAMRIRVLEMELMPAGGAARMENLWSLRPGQMAAVALAGPLCSLLAAVTAAGLCWWRLLPPDKAALAVEQNLFLCLFNLLPALPLDGGRVLCGILSRRLSPGAAARTGVRVSVFLAAALLILSGYGLMRGHMNITLPVAALFLLVSAGKERRQSEISSVESLAGRWRELETEGAMPLRMLAVREDAPAREAATRIRPRFMHLLAVYDAQLRLTGIIDEGELLRALMSDGGRPVGTLKKVLNPEFFGESH